MSTYKDISLIPGNTDNNLVAWYKMDDLADSTVVINERGIDGTAVRNTSLMHTAGKISGALSFNGSTDYINTNQSFESVFRDSFTVSFWCKIADGIGSTCGLFSAYSTSGTDDIITIHKASTGIIYGAFVADEKPITVDSVSTFFIDGQNDYKMITMVASSTDNGTKGNLALYINGELVKQGNSSACIFSNYTSVLSPTVAVTNLNGSLSQFFNGQLDNFMLFNKALSSTEVLDLYNYDFFLPPGYTELDANDEYLATEDIKFYFTAAADETATIIINDVSYIIKNDNNEYLIWDLNGINYTFTTINEKLSVNIDSQTKMTVIFRGTGSLLFDIYFADIEQEKAISANNFIVVYIDGDTDSEDFATHYANIHKMNITNTDDIDISGSKDGTSWVAKGQMVGIGSATTEILDSRETFDLNILNPIKEALNSSELINRNIWGIVLGYKVPGGFYSDNYDYTGDIISSTSYLSRACICDEHGLFLSSESKISNKLYNRSVYKQFDSLDAQEALIVSRIDAPSLAIAKIMVDNANILSKKRFVNGTFYIDPYANKFGDDAIDYTNLLLYFYDNVLPQLNLETWTTNPSDPYTDSVIPFVQNDSFMWSWFTDRATSSFFQMSSKGRTFFYNADFDGANSLREETLKTWPFLSIMGGYATTAGAMSDPGIDGFLNPNAFFKALINRATIGEAYLYSLPYLNWTMTLIGDPLTSICFPDVAIPDETVLTASASWELMSKDIAKASAYLYKKAIDTNNIIKACTDSQDLQTKLVISPCAQKYYAKNSDDSRVSQLQQITQKLFTYATRLYTYDGIQVKNPTIDEYLTFNNFRVSQLLLDMVGATVSSANIYPEGYWELDFTLEDYAAAFINYHFKINIYSDEEMLNLISSFDSGESQRNWYYEQTPNTFVSVSIDGVPASYISRRIRYISGVEDYLSRGNIYYFNVMQYNSQDIYSSSFSSIYADRTFKEIIYT